MIEHIWQSSRFDQISRIKGPLPAQLALLINLDQMINMNVKSNPFASN